MSERRSPPTGRVVRILNLLAENPRRRLSLSAIAGSLDLSKPTCLGILGELADAGFVTRDAERTYGLGPALLRIGTAAGTGLAALDVVRPHLRALYERTGVGCLLTAVHDDLIVVVDRLGGGLGDQRDVVGDRYPFAPPLGLVNVAWNGDHAVDTWLARPCLGAGPVDAHAARAVIADARARGYVLERLTGATTTPNNVLASLHVSGLPAAVIAELGRHLPPTDWSEYAHGIAEDDRAALPVATLSAPVTDHRGAQRYTVTLVLNRSRATAGECREWARSLREAARAASAALGAVAGPGETGLSNGD